MSTNSVMQIRLISSSHVRWPRWPFYRRQCRRLRPEGRIFRSDPLVKPPAKTYCFHISYLSIMQKFRQHNKIFVRACNWGQNAVKYSLTKNGQTAVRGQAIGELSPRTARDSSPALLPAAAGSHPQDVRRRNSPPSCRILPRYKGKTEL